MKKCFSFLLASLLMLGGCAQPGEDDGVTEAEAPSLSRSVSGGVLERPEGSKEGIQGSAVSFTASHGEGSFLSSSEELLPEQERLILDYMDRYYESLARLEVIDPSDLFASDAQTQALGNRTAWEYLVGVREMQRTDLSLVSYEYELECSQVQQEDDGTLRLTVTEDSTQNFAAHPQVDSRTLGVRHTFTMAQENGAWKLKSHMQMDSLYFSLLGRLGGFGMGRQSGTALTGGAGAGLFGGTAGGFPDPGSGGFVCPGRRAGGCSLGRTCL